MPLATLHPYTGSVVTVFMLESVQVSESGYGELEHASI